MAKSPKKNNNQRVYRMVFGNVYPLAFARCVMLRDGLKKVKKLVRPRDLAGLKFHQIVELPVFSHLTHLSLAYTYWNQ